MQDVLNFISIIIVEQGACENPVEILKRYTETLRKTSKMNVPNSNGMFRFNSRTINVIYTVFIELAFTL